MCRFSHIPTNSLVKLMVSAFCQDCGGLFDYVGDAYYRGHCQPTNFYYGDYFDFAGTFDCPHCRSGHRGYLERCEDLTVQLPVVATEERGQECTVLTAVAK